MNIKKTLVGVAITIGSLTSIAAYAWSIQEEHPGWDLIRCVDGSNSTVEQLSDGYWTVKIAGKNGKLGGHFAIVGQAALQGCGPE